MIQELSPDELRQHLDEVLDRVQDRHDSIVISKDGKPVAALVDADLFGRIRRMRSALDALSARIAEAYASVPEEQGIAEIDAACTR